MRYKCKKCKVEFDFTKQDIKQIIQDITFTNGVRIVVVERYVICKCCKEINYLYRKKMEEK